MLVELAREAPRPSRIANAGELLKGKRPDVPVLENESPAGLRLETQAWKVEIARHPFAIDFANKLTGMDWKLAGVQYLTGGGVSGKSSPGSAPNPALRLQQFGSIEKHEGSWVLQGVLEGSTLPIRIEISVASRNALAISIEAAKLGPETTSTFRVVAPGPLFGLGEQFAKSELRNFRTSLHPDDKPGTPGHKWDYMSVPFVYGPKGTGMYFDTAFNCVFDSTQAGQPGFLMQFSGPSVDFYLIAAESPKDVLRTYTAITGRSPLPPPWAFGVWHNTLQGRGSVLKDAQDLRDARIPASALWIPDLIDHRYNLGWPLFTFGYYGTPGPLTADLHELGFKVLVHFSPYVRSRVLPYQLENPTFVEGVRNHYLVTRPDGKPAGPTFEDVPTGNVDFTNPAAVNWWQAKIEGALKEYNFDGWMEDFGEWVRDDDRFAAGKSGRVMASLNPLFYHKMAYEVVHSLKPDAVRFARSGAPGSQAFSPILWGGDQFDDWTWDNGFPSAVTAGITAGLSGFSIWGPDISSASPSKELFIRWTEFGALTPIMRDHLWDKPKFAVDLWFDYQATDVFRNYARLHVSLFPYLYTYAHEATETGLPIIRHPMLEFPDDPATAETEYEYLLGDRLLVAPVVTEGATTRALYLPKGDWVNYWTGEIVEGGRELTVPAPIEEIPIFVKAGSAIPFTRPDLDTMATDLAGGKYQTLDNALVWRIFPCKGASTAGFAVYDGAKISVEQNTNQVQVLGEAPKVRQYEVVVPLAQAPRNVLLSGRRLERLDNPGAFPGKEGWTFDSTTKALHVRFLSSDFKLHVAI
jgi:alpha-D-xyloside xylohydrolase